MATGRSSRSSRPVPRCRLERDQGDLGLARDVLLAEDVDGVLLDRMNTTVDGEYQKLAVELGALHPPQYFGLDPRRAKWSKT